MGVEYSLRNDGKFVAESGELDIQLRNKIREVFLRELKKIIALKNQLYKRIEIEGSNRARQARVEDMVMPVFEGINYSSWKLRLLTL